MTDDDNTLRAKLATDLHEGPWAALDIHAERGHLVFVAAELLLLDVAMAVARDDSAQVTEWLQTGKLYKPTSDRLETLRQSPQQLFHFVIVQPFVLVTAQSGDKDKSAG